MDECDQFPIYRDEQRVIEFKFWVEGGLKAAAVGGEALDKLAGGDAGGERGCVATYAQHWQQLHAIAALKYAAGYRQLTVYVEDV